MDCQYQHIVEKLVPYIEGALADVDRREVQLHLQDCQMCSQEVRSLNQVVTSLRARVGTTLHFLPAISLSPDDILDYALDSGGLSETTRRRIQLHLVESLDCQQEVERLRELELEPDSPEAIAVPAFPTALSRALDEAYGTKTRPSAFKWTFLRRLQPRTLAAGLAGLLLSGLAAHSMLGKPDSGALATTAVPSQTSPAGEALSSDPVRKNGELPMVAIVQPQKAESDVKRKNNRPEPAVSKQSKSESPAESPGAGQPNDKRVRWGNRSEIPQADSMPSRPTGSVNYYVSGAARANPPAQLASDRFRQSTETSGAQTQKREAHQEPAPRRDDQIAVNVENTRARTRGELAQTGVNYDKSEPSKPVDSKVVIPNPEPKANEVAIEPSRVPVSNVESARPEKSPELPAQVAARNPQPVNPTFDELERRSAPVRQGFRHEEYEPNRSSGTKSLPGWSDSEPAAQLPGATSKSDGVVGGITAEETSAGRSHPSNTGMVSVDTRTVPPANRSVLSKDSGDLGLLQQAQRLVAEMELVAEVRVERRQDNSLLISVRPQRALDPQTSEQLRQALRTKLKLADTDSVVIRRP